VYDRVELCNPRVARAPVEPLLARSPERLIAESRQRERDEVFDLPRPDRDDRRFRDEPRRPPRNLSGHTIAPEVLARLRGWQGEAMTRGEAAFRVRPPRPGEHQHIRHVDE